VVIDLGERGILFALINWDSYKEVYDAFPLDSFDIDKRLNYYQKLKPRTKADLKINQPKIVTFTNINDPKTVVVVYENTLYANGHKKTDNFEKVFGKDITLKTITIEMTDDPVTWDVEKYISPFNKSFWEWRKKLKYDDPRKIGFYNFKVVVE